MLKTLILKTVSYNLCSIKDSVMNGCITSKIEISLFLCHNNKTTICISTFYGQNVLYTARSSAESVHSYSEMKTQFSIPPPNSRCHQYP